MTNDMIARGHNELFQIIHAASDVYGANVVFGCISRAHLGQPQGFINTNNLHLFRRYRNQVSGNVHRMMKDAGIKVPAPF